MTFLFWTAAIIPALVVALVAYLVNRDVTNRYGLNAKELATAAATALDDRVLEAKDELRRLAAKLPPPPSAVAPDADAAPESQLAAKYLRLLSTLQDTFPVLIITDDRRLTYAEERTGIYLDSSPEQIPSAGRKPPFAIPTDKVAILGYAITHTQAFDTRQGPVSGFWIHAALPPPPAAPGVDPATTEHLPTHYLSGFFNSQILLETLQKQRIDGKLTDEGSRFILLDANGRKLGDSLPGSAATMGADAVKADAEGVTIPADSLVEPATPPKSATASTAKTAPTIAEAQGPVSGHIVRAIIDPTRFKEDHESGGKILMMLLIGLLGLTALFCLPLARGFLAPMYKLLDGARAWQGGDMNYLFRGRQAEGEWAELAESMNGLAARIHAQRFEPRDAQPAPDLPAAPSTAPDSPLVQEDAHVKSLLRAATETESEGLLITDENGRPLYTNTVFWETWEKSTQRPGLTLPSGASKRKLPIYRILRQTLKTRAHVRRLRDLGTQPALKLSGQLDLKDSRRLQFSVRPFMLADQIKGRIWRFRDISARSRLEEEVRTSKQLMEKLVESLPMALFVKDVSNEFRIILWNKAAEALYGIPAMNIIGQPTDNVQPPELAAFLGENDLAALQTGGPVEIAQQHLSHSPNGARLLRVVKVPIYDQRRMATHLFCLAEDITERNHAEQSVRREHALLRGLIDSLPDLISFKSHAGVYLGCNKAFEEFTGLQEKDFLGRTDEVLFGNLNLSLPPKIDRTILTDAQPRWRAAELNLPDGRVAHLNTVETPLRGPLGEVWGILAVSQVAAITEAKAATA